MDVNIAALTVSVVEPEIPPELAEIVEFWPADFAFARPLEEIGTAAAFDELQVTELVRSWVLLSEYVPVA
jgi:hypothetical protein